MSLHFFLEPVLGLLEQTIRILFKELAVFSSMRYCGDWLPGFAASKIRKQYLYYPIVVQTMN